MQVNTLSLESSTDIERQGGVFTFYSLAQSEKVNTVSNSGVHQVQWQVQQVQVQVHFEAVFRRFGRARHRAIRLRRRWAQPSRCGGTRWWSRIEDWQ